MNKPIKQKKCKHCRELFTPFRSLETWCSPDCAIEILKAKKAKEFNKETTRRKTVLRESDKGKQMKLADQAFGKFIRARDEDKPCISCGREFVEYTRGGSWDCGHYKSRGASPELRYCEDNAHKQCKSCNGGSSKYAGKGKTVGTEYTERLIERLGQDKVDWLNGPHELKHYKVDDYIAIKAKYNAMYREIRGDE